jgi:hypothetical protein
VGRPAVLAPTAQRAASDRDVGGREHDPGSRRLPLLLEDAARLADPKHADAMTDLGGADKLARASDLRAEALSLARELRMEPLVDRLLSRREA